MPTPINTPKIPDNLLAKGDITNVVPEAWLNQKRLKQTLRG